MAHKPAFTLDGTALPNVYEASYQIYTMCDDLGRPTKRALAGKIRVVRESDDNVMLATWATDSSESNFKPGQIVFFSPEGDEWKTVKFEKAYATSYSEYCPHTQKNEQDQLYEVVEISAEHLEVEDAVVDNNWKDKRS